MPSRNIIQKLDRNPGKFIFAAIAFYGLIGTSIEYSTGDDKEESRKKVFIFSILLAIALCITLPSWDFPLKTNIGIVLSIVSVYLLIIGGVKYARDKSDKHRVILVVGGVLNILSIPFLMPLGMKSLAHTLLYTGIGVLIGYGVVYHEAEQKSDRARKEESSNILKWVGIAVSILFGIMVVVGVRQGLKPIEVVFEASMEYPLATAHRGIGRDGMARATRLPQRSALIDRTFETLFGRRR